MEPSVIPTAVPVLCRPVRICLGGTSFCPQPGNSTSCLLHHIANSGGFLFLNFPGLVKCIHCCFCGEQERIEAMWEVNAENVICLKVTLLYLSFTLDCSLGCI